MIFGEKHAVDVYIFILFLSLLCLLFFINITGLKGKVLDGNRAVVRRCLLTKTIREQHPRPHHSGAAVRRNQWKEGAQAEDRLHQILCLCQLDSDIPTSVMHFSKPLAL